jgi:hypothetical protein
MITTEQIHKFYGDLQKEAVRAVHIEVLNQLRSKPDIKINEDKLRQLTDEKRWSAIFGTYNTYVDLLSYKDVPLDVKISPYNYELLVRFPEIRTHSVKAIHRYEYYRDEKLGYYQQGESYSTTVYRVSHINKQIKAISRKDTDDLYNNIVEAYGRYDKSKAKGKTLEAATEAAKLKNEQVAPKNAANRAAAVIAYDAKQKKTAKF